MSKKPMTIEEIPADQVVIMNKYWHRAFTAAGCDPECHCCFKSIKPGGKFKLATVETIQKYDVANNTQGRELTTREVMLCDECTPKKADENAKKYKVEYNKRRASG